MLDTRAASGITGAFGPPSLVGDPTQSGRTARVIPVPASSCGLPAASAYSLYLTVVPPAGGGVAFLAAWPDNEAWPGTATLNDPTGGVLGVSAIVPAGTDGGYAATGSDYAIPQGGVALPVFAPGKLLKPGPFGGGNGGGVVSTGTSGNGGGSIVILAAGAISITGSITANGARGSSI